jgi:hypothetical protein
MSYLDVEMPECLDLLVPTDGASSPKQQAGSPVQRRLRRTVKARLQKEQSEQRRADRGKNSTQILVARIDQIKTKLMCLDEHQTRFIICVVLSRLLSSLNWDTFCARYINRHAD